MTPQAIYSVVKHTAAASRIDIQTHGLRRTAAILAGGADIRQIQQMLGQHATQNRIELTAMQTQAYLQRQTFAMAPAPIPATSYCVIAVTCWSWA